MQVRQAQCHVACQTQQLEHGAVAVRVVDEVVQGAHLRVTKAVGEGAEARRPSFHTQPIRSSAQPRTTAGLPRQPQHHQ